MNKKWFLAIIPGVLALMILMFVVALFLIKILWAWTIPDIFPGAVAQNLIVAELSWLTSFKLALFVAVLFGIAKGSYKHERNN
jgi:hypothetical protein